MVAGSLPVSDNQSIFNHYATYVNFMAVLFGVVLPILLTSNPSAMNQLLIGAVVFSVNFASFFGLQQTSRGSISCSKTHKRSCVFRIIFYITAILSPGMLFFILAGQINWQPMMDAFRNINNLVFGETIAAAPEIQDSIHQRILAGVSNFLGRLTDQRTPPILPVNMPPRTATRWSSVTAYARRFIDLTEQIVDITISYWRRR